MQWAKAITGTHDVNITSSVVDAQQNLYVVGNFYGTVDLDPGTGVATQTAGYTYLGGRAYFAKYNANGEHTFSYAIGDTGQLSISAIALDNSGHVYVVGGFNGTVDIDPGSGVANLTSTGGYNFFLAKYDLNGNYISAFSLTNSLTINGLIVDDQDNCYVYGEFDNTVDFEPGTGVTDLTVSNNSGFFAKYSSAGTLIFAKAISSTYSSSVEGLVVDANQNIFLGGVFQQNIDVDPGPNVVNISAIAGSDGYWAKYDAAGNYLKSYSYNGGVNLMSMDGDGNFYISGRITGTMDMDPGPGTNNLISTNSVSGPFEMYFAKYDGEGNYIHGHILQSNFTCIQNDVTNNFQNGFLMAGRLPDTLYCIDETTTTGMLTSQGGQDAFINKYDASGNYEFAYSLGSTSNDHGNTINTDAQGNVWFAGYFYDTIDMDLTSGTSNITAGTAARSVFIGKYTDVGALTVDKGTTVNKGAKIFSVKDKVIVDLSMLDKLDAQVIVFDMLGRNIIKTKCHSNTILKLDMSAYASQVYVVAVTNNEATTVTKVWVE